MKVGSRKNAHPDKTPEKVAAKLLRMFPQKYKGMNLLAGTALWLAVVNDRIRTGAYRKRRSDCKN